MAMVVQRCPALVDLIESTWYLAVLICRAGDVLMLSEGQPGVDNVFSVRHGMTLPISV